MPKIALQDIKQGERLREDYGDIPGLTASLEQHGLLHPIILDDQRNLICGGRRVQAAAALGWDEIEYRDIGTLSERERRMVELEENLQRKDLTSYERDRKLVDLDEAVGEVLREEATTEFSAEFAENSPEGRPSKPDSKERRAERIGIPRKTIADARQRLETVQSYPFMQSPGWKPYHVMEAREKLGVLPEPHRHAAAELVDQPGIPPKDAIDILKNLAGKSDAEREEIFRLRGSEYGRDKSLALTRAADLAPRADPRVTKLDNYRRGLEKAAVMFPGDPFNQRFIDAARYLKTLADELHVWYQRKATQ